jgi:hypothetical protein
MTRLMEVQEELEIAEAEIQLAEAEEKLAEIQEKRRSDDVNRTTTTTQGS